MTAIELQKLIEQLQKQIAQLQRQLNEVQMRPEAWCHDFKVDLRYGDRGSEVSALQTALKKEEFAISKREIGGTYFGNWTASAVVGFQEKYRKDILSPLGLAHGTGFVGKTTRTKLNELYGCKKPVPPVTKPHIKVLSPNGGEKWEIGKTYEIAWDSAGVKNINILLINYASPETCYLNTELSCTGEAYPQNCKPVPISAKLGKYSFKLEQVRCFPGMNQHPMVDIESGNMYKVKIVDADNPRINDTSDGYFSLISIISNCGNGVCDEEETPETCPQDCAYEIYPYNADVESCTAASGKVYPTTGEGSATWFVWNGCAHNKYYKVNPGEKLMFLATTDACGDCMCWHPNFHVYEYEEGNWVEKRYFDLPDKKGIRKVVSYTPTSSKIKIYASQCFYLNVYSLTPTEPFVKVTSPNGGESWKIGKSYTIKWESKGVKKVNILLVDYQNPETCYLNGVEKEDLICEESEQPYSCRPKPIDASLGSFTIEKLSQVRCFPGMNQMSVVDISSGSQYKIKIEAAEDPQISDFSDNYFGIVEPDISASFTKTNFEYDSSQLQIFGQVVSNGKAYYANLDGASDDTYTTSRRYCSFDGKYHYYPDAWDIERKYVSPTKYKILVRGNSDADCGKGQPQNTGWIKLNSDSGWKITEVVKCNVSSDTLNSNNVLIDTYCKVNKEEGTIEWQSGSTCGGCCACPDGAGVNIEIIVEKGVTSTSATSTSANAILKSVGNQLASVSKAISQLMERMAGLVKKR